MSLLDVSLYVLAEPVNINDDVELIEDFGGIDFPIEISLNPGFTEQKHILTHFLIRGVRNKRSPKYDVLESAEIKSHLTRSKRNTDGKDSSNDNKKDTEQASSASVETLPVAEKLLSNSAFYQDQWAQYARNSNKEALDSQAEASAINEGIKARAPRVNFITQNQNRDAKSLDVSESRDARSSVLPETTTPDYYRKNLARIYLDYPRPYDSYPRPAEQYDRNYIDRYSPVYSDHYDNRRTFEEYDSYMPRTLTYPNFYYYPDKRYDVPEPREPFVPASGYPANAPGYPANAPGYPANAPAPAMPPGYGLAPGPYTPNEIPPLSPTNRNRRIIYYTTLPEVVRTPPNVNLNYNQYKSRTPYDPYEKYDRYNPYSYYYNFVAPPVQQMNPQGYYPQGPAGPHGPESYRSNRSPRDYTRTIGSITQIRSNRKEDYNQQKTTTPSNNNSNNNNNNDENNKNHYKNIRSDSRNTSPDRRMFTEIKDGRPSYQDGAEDREHYFSRHH